MRSMARPLAQSPLARPAASGRPGSAHHSLSVVPSPSRESARTASYQRSGRVGGTRSHGEPGRRTHVHHGYGPRQELRRRRTNVLFLLTMALGASLFLAATTRSSVMMYALALSFLSLCAYCYRLVQLRQLERPAQHQDAAWFRAA